MLRLFFHVWKIRGRNSDLHFKLSVFLRHKWYSHFLCKTPFILVCTCLYHFLISKFPNSRSILMKLEGSCGFCWRKWKYITLGKSRKCSYSITNNWESLSQTWLWSLEGKSFTMIIAPPNLFTLPYPSLNEAPCTDHVTMWIMTKHQGSCIKEDNNLLIR